MAALFSQNIDDLCTQHYTLIDQFLDHGWYMRLHELIYRLHQQQLFHQAKIGQSKQKQINANIRQDQICWLDKQLHHPPLAIFIDQLKVLMNSLNAQLYLGLKEIESHFALYEPGAFYKKHRDQFNQDDTRRISCVYYLNPDWQPQFGGELVLYDTPVGEVNISPKGNRLACFVSNLVHEVKMTHQPRASITSWFKVQKNLIYQPQIN